MELSPLQQKFVNNLLKGMPQKEAYIRAGYRARGNSAESKASRLVRNGKVKAVYDKLQAKAEKKAVISRARILEEYAKIAFFNPQKLYDEYGNLIPIHDLDPDVAVALGRMDAVKRKTRNGEIITTKIKFIDKIRALEALARNKGMFKNNVNIGADAEIINAILDGLPEELRQSVRESLRKFVSSKRG